MTNANHTPDAIGLLLAGGGSRRAGVDKRFLVLEGRTLLQRNLEFLRELFPLVALSLAPGQELDVGDAAAAGTIELVHDAWPGASPLAGIASALARFDRPVFALAVDVAFPSRAAAERVLAAYPGHDVALPAIGRHYQPLFAVYGPGCLAPMKTMLEADVQRVIELLPRVRSARVPFPDDALFHSINTRDEYRTALELAARHAADPAGDQRGEHRAGDRPALVAVVGKSDSGKTTLIEKLVPALTALGLRVGTVKHDAHSFEIDHPGKDSWRHGQAGAHAYVIASPGRLAYIAKLDGEMALTDIARRYFGGFDLVVAEGYKRTAPHRVEIFRRAAGHDVPLCAPGEAMAVVTDAPLQHDHLFALDDGPGLARFLAVRLDTLRRY
jgi:molybdopterin-guanine dinucleotide biosynthesis protein